MSNGVKTNMIFTFTELLEISVWKMCLLFYYLNPNPKKNTYKLILINGRDELYNRPTAKAHVWKTTPKIIAGRDVMPGREGGTWLGASSTGKIGLLLNIFQPKQSPAKSLNNLASRGFLVVNYLSKDLSSSEYIESIKSSNVTYDKFALVMFELNGSNFKVDYYNNEIDSFMELGYGIQGVGNCLMDKKFQKVLKGEERLKAVVEEFGQKDHERELIEAMFAMMKDKERHKDEILFKQGEGHPNDYLEGLSSCWVTIPSINYGTRTLTVILVDFDNNLSYEERTMRDPSPTCDEWDISTFKFSLPTLTNKLDL